MLNIQKMLLYGATFPNYMYHLFCTGNGVLNVNEHIFVRVFQSLVVFICDVILGVVQHVHYCSAGQASFCCSRLYKIPTPLFMLRFNIPTPLLWLEPLD